MLQRWNLALIYQNVRVTMEWAFRKAKMYFSTAHFKRKMKVTQARVGALYLFDMLFCSFQNCIYSISAAQYFNGAPAPLEERVYHK